MVGQMVGEGAAQSRVCQPPSKSQGPSDGCLLKGQSRPESCLRGQPWSGLIRQPRVLSLPHRTARTLQMGAGRGQLPQKILHLN